MSGTHLEDRVLRPAASPRCTNAPTTSASPCLFFWAWCAQNPVRTPSGHCPSLIPHPPSGPRQSAFIYSIFYIIHKLACCDPRHKRKKQGTEEVEETEEEVEARARELAAQMIQAQVRGNMVRKAFASRT